MPLQLSDPLDSFHHLSVFLDQLLCLENGSNTILDCLLSWRKLDPERTNQKVVDHLLV